MQTITLEQVQDIEAREAVKHEYLKQHKKNWLSKEECDKLPQVTNEERSNVEFYYWQHTKPSSYFLYINEEKKLATTWTGQELGKVSFGKEYKSIFRDTRQSITVYGNNGLIYHGTYYKSAGDYARIKQFKGKKGSANYANS